MSYRVLVLGAALTTLAGVSVAFAQSTTRIEPRPVYGAIVTIEEGVRVFRPLPPERHVIINPGGATPLNLGLADVNVNSQSHSVNRTTNIHRYDRGWGWSRYPYSYAPPCIPAVGTSC